MKIKKQMIRIADEIIAEENAETDDFDESRICNKCGAVDSMMNIPDFKNDEVYYECSKCGAEL